ncbi:MAG: GH1 family beta-glucosidase [Pseudomonadota bacterium]
MLQKSGFPEDFAWGVATSSFQIEGAASEDGRGDSVWDTFCRNPANTLDASNGLIACDHYHRLEEDLDLIASLGVDAYRFSMAWPRVQPLGRGPWNEAGFDFYDRLIRGLEKRGIKAYLTLFHWDLPQALQDQDGWANRETCDRFADYAAEVARRFGHRLASITTHNEPWVVAILGHETGIFAPGLKDRKTAYQVSHHLLLSHGMALQRIRASGSQVPLGIVLNQSPIYPATTSPEDIAKAHLDDGLIVRWYMDPLFRGHYPQDVLALLGDDAPVTQPGDMDIIRQPLDFLGINYYTRNFSSASSTQPTEEAKAVTDMGWEIFPEGLTVLLERLNCDYPIPAIYITENGAAFKDALVNGQVNDEERVSYLRGHIEATRQAIHKGVDVKGYFVWSLLDNFEWASGYEKRFGIVYVDYASQQRVKKESALWYQSFLNG